MTPLSEALLASQRQAIGALSKAFLAGRIDAEHLLEELDAIGCRDVVEQGTLLAALMVMHRYGTAAAAPTTGEARPAENEPATERQTKYMQKLADERGTVAPDYALTKKQASTVIEELQAGTYNPDSWTVPF